MSDFESFEAQMQELEQIVQQMESRSLNLAESMKAHKRGMKLSKECEKILSKAQKQLELYQTEDNNDSTGTTEIPNDTQ
tara:strand:+ start:3537 stop:3773 length:237 start_codon:yes stop_codon:yes gene_type:complete